MHITTAETCIFRRIFWLLRNPLQAEKHPNAKILSVCSPYLNCPTWSLDWKATRSCGLQVPKGPARKHGPKAWWMLLYILLLFGFGGELPSLPSCEKMIGQLTYRSRWKRIYKALRLAGRFSFAGTTERKPYNTELVALETLTSFLEPMNETVFMPPDFLIWI